MGRTLQQIELLEKVRRALSTSVTELMNARDLRDPKLDSAIQLVVELMAELDSDRRCDWEKNMPAGQVMLISDALSRLHKEWLKYAAIQDVALGSGILAAVEALAEPTTLLRQAMVDVFHLVGYAIEGLTYDGDADINSLLDRFGLEQNIARQWRLARRISGLSAREGPKVEDYYRAIRAHYGADRPSWDAESYKEKVKNLLADLILKIDVYMRTVNRDLELRHEYGSEISWQKQAKMTAAHSKNAQEVVDALHALLQAVANRPVELPPPPRGGLHSVSASLGTRRRPRWGRQRVWGG